MMNSWDLVSYIGILAFLFQLNRAFAFNCNFDSDTCRFDQSTDDQFDWTRHTGSTGSPLTGPKNGDHTSGNGYYMYIDVTGRTRGDKAVLKKTITATDKNCLEFYFHMFSTHGTIGDLNVYVDDVRSFHLSGAQENAWKKGKVNFNLTGSHLVAFEATKEDDNVGQIAIDDIKTYTCYKPENVTLILEINKPSNIFLVGEKLSFICQSSAEPTPCTMSFTFPGYTDSKSVESKNCSARFEMVIQGCGLATLTCQAVNEEGTGTNSLLLTVQESPAADITSKKSYLEGTKVQVFCTAKGCPAPTLTWTKQGNVSSISTSSSGFLILEFASIAIENGGVYQCTAENGAVGSPVSKTVDVKVFHKPYNVRLMTNKSDNVFLKGDFVNVTCNAIANPPPCKIIIYLQFISIFNTSSSSDCSESHVISNVVGCGEQVLSCTASNSVGIAQNVVKKMFIQVPPYRMSTIPARQSGNDLYEGSSLMFTCFAYGCPNPILTWTKTEVQEPLARGNQSTLTYSLGSLSKENTGYYNCTADNGVLNPVILTVYINVLYKPRNTKVTTNRSSNVFLQGESVAFTCQSEANPLSCSVSLNRDGQILSQQTKSDCSLSHVITNIQGCNEVLFSCMASNSLGKGVVTNKLITVQVPAVIGIRPAGSIVAKKEGSPLVLNCDAKGCPTPSVSWSKIGSGVSLSKGNGSVHYTFANLRIKDSGTYRCDANNGIIGRSVFSTIDVNVTYQPENTKLTTNKPGDVFLFGDSVEFTCSSSANPNQCTVVFQKGNVVLTTINSKTCTAKYVLRNIKGCNLETFSCNASNSIGKGLMAHKNVTVQVPVTMNMFPVNDTLVMKEGSSLDLICKATGCPTPIITWKNSRNAKPYMETTGHYLAHNFTSVDKEHRGHHMCIVDNGIVGSPVNLSIFVNITYGPFIKTLPRQPSVTLYENDQVDLTCEVDSNPPAVTIWTKDHSNSIIARGERLKLSAEQSTSGNYTCTATNGYGLTKKVTFIAKVKACQDNKCTFNISCISRGTTYYCDCPKGLTGRLCDENDPFKSKFTVTFYIVNIAWTNNYKDAGSPAYKLVENRICWEMKRLFGDELANCELISLRKGSVISETRLTLKKDKYRSKVLGVIKAETVNDTLGPLILDQSALVTRVEPYSSFCGDQPCKFEGTCYEQGDGYRCDCKLFRFGTQCEKGIGFIPGVAVIVIGSIVLVAIICLIAYFWKRAKRGSFAKGSAEVQARLTPKKQTKSPPQDHPLSSNNVYVSVEQDDKDKKETVAKHPEPEDPYDEATKL